MTKGERFRTALLMQGVEAAEKIRKRGGVDVDELANGRNALHDACSGGDPLAVEYLLGVGASTEIRAEASWEDGSVGSDHLATALMLAAASYMGGSRSPKCLRLLIEAGAELNAQDHEGKTALFYAVQFPERVRALLDAGADPDLTDRRGYTVLTLARRAAADGMPEAELDFLRMATAGEVTADSPREVVEILESRGAVTQGADSAALLRAAADGDAAKVAALLDAGADPDFRDDGTALTAAASAGHLEVVRLLLDRGADVDRTESDRPAGDFTALGRAAHRGRLEVVKLLLERGADPSIGPFGMRPIEHAKESKANDRNRYEREDEKAPWDEIIDALRGAAGRTPEARSLLLGERGVLADDARETLAALGLDAGSFAEASAAGTLVLEGLPTPLAEIAREWPRLVGLARPRGWTLFATSRSIDEIEPREQEIIEDAQSAERGSAAAWFASRREAFDLDLEDEIGLDADAIGPDAGEIGLDAGEIGLDADEVALDAGEIAPLDNAPRFGDVMGNGGTQARLALIRGDIGWAPIVYRFGGWNDCPAPADQAMVLRAWQAACGVELAYLGHDILELVREAPLSDKAQIEALAPEIGLYCSESDSVEDNLRVARSRTWFFWWD